MARGKTKGAGSFVKIDLRELNRVLKEDATIVVSRRFAEALDLNTDGFVSNTKNQQSMQPVEIENTDLQPVEITKEDW